MRVTIFTGSSFGNSPAYRLAAAELGESLAREGVGIVYGGGRVGLMGALADAALGAGGEVVGVMPRALVQREIAHTQLSRLIEVETMHERKAAMAEQADAFVALPGGSGTLEELFEAWTWQHLGYHDKPVLLYDVGDFWRPLSDLLRQLVESGFLRAEYRDTLPVVSDPRALLDTVRSWRVPSDKWGAETSTDAAPPHAPAHGSR